jgi:hypothetical protein
MHASVGSRSITVSVASGQELIESDLESLLVEGPVRDMVSVAESIEIGSMTYLS